MQHPDTIRKDAAKHRQWMLDFIRERGGRALLRDLLEAAPIVTSTVYNNMDVLVKEGFIVRGKAGPRMVMLHLATDKPYPVADSLKPKAAKPKRADLQQENERLREVLAEAMTYACHDDECEVMATGRCNCWCVSARRLLDRA